MNLFDLVNSDSEENIAKRLGLPLANDKKSYICPECGNGSGSTGDGIKQSTWNGRLVWHCYRCGGHWSNVDLIALVKGIETTDTKELVKGERIGRRISGIWHREFFFFQGKFFCKTGKVVGAADFAKELWKDFLSAL